MALPSDRAGGLRPEPQASQPEALIPSAVDEDRFLDDEDEFCWSCDGEGFVLGCSWDWQCETYDEGEGTCLCVRRCSVCNPSKAQSTENDQ